MTLNLVLKMYYIYLTRDKFRLQKWGTFFSTPSHYVRVWELVFQSSEKKGARTKRKNQTDELKKECSLECNDKSRNVWGSGGVGFFWGCVCVCRTCQWSQLIRTPAYNHLLVCVPAPDRLLTDVVIIWLLEYAHVPLALCNSDILACLFTVLGSCFFVSGGFFFCS